MYEESLLNSPDLRGGGGEGGIFGDFRGSRRGVFGRLGIRKCLGEEAAEDDAERGPSVDKNAEGLDKARFNFLFLGGDWGA